MTPKIKVETVSVQKAISNYMLATNLDFERPALRICRGFMRRVVGITPPASGDRGEGGALTLADKKRGESAIDSDLSALFAGVKIKRKRPEQFPNPAAIHRAAFVSGKRPGKRLRNPRGRGNFYHVDEKKLRALAAELKTRIGKLASGWLSGADAVKATGIPQWVRRHGPSRGKHVLLVEFSRTNLTRTHGLKFEAANTSVHPALVPEMTRRIGYALQYAANSLQRETEAIVARRTSEFNRGRF